MVINWQAEALIARDRPDVVIKQIPKNAMMTMDYSESRVACGF